MTSAETSSWRRSGSGNMSESMSSFLKWEERVVGIFAIDLLKVLIQLRGLTNFLLAIHNVFFFVGGWGGSTL